MEISISLDWKIRDWSHFIQNSCSTTALNTEFYIIIWNLNSWDIILVSLNEKQKKDSTGGTY